MPSRDVKHIDSPLVSPLKDSVPALSIARQKVLRAGRGTESVYKGKGGRRGMDCIAESVTRNAYPRYLSHQLQSLLQTSKVVEIDDSDQKCGLYASQPRANLPPRRRGAKGPLDGRPDVQMSSSSSRTIRGDHEES
jgi:hypothetical protein